MANLTVSATFTKSSGQPATALTLAELSFFLTQQDKSTGIDATVWDGTQVATVEINNVGTYTRILSTADLTAYSYFAMVQYTGATVLDSNYVYGAIGEGEAVLSTAGNNAIADALLKRDWTAVTGEAARSMLNALRFLRNKVLISGATLTVNKEDDTTAAWTAAVTTSYNAQPVIGIDPT